MSDAARLILFAPSEENTDALCARLAPLVEAVPFDAVILPVTGSDDRARINHAKSVAAIVQKHNAALLLVDAFELVARTGADGVHLTSAASLSEALAVLKPLDRIVGVGGLKARHDAMEAAEAGTDYVMFGEPRADGSLPLSSAVHERAAWWAELFQTPCVAFATDHEMAVALAETGAEFVAFAPDILAPSDDAQKALKELHQAIISAHRPER